MDAVGSNIRVDTYGWEVKRVLPRNNDDINEEWISDKTRYACDGLKNQRLDTPFLKKDGKFEKITWNEAYDILTKKIESVLPDKIAGITGDLTDMETMYIVKEFFEKTIKSPNLDSRDDHVYVDNSHRSNYIFNPTLNGIEESDLVLIIGANPRYEATILNSRIRKSYLSNNLQIFSYGDVGDLTYPYKILPNDTSEIKTLINGDNELSKKIILAKKPIVILGQSFFKLKSAQNLFYKLKDFLKSNGKINEDWNAIGIISNHSSTVGAYDLDLINSESNRNSTLENIQNNKNEIIFLFGQDNLNFTKKNEFVVYIGTHGDKGAEISDLILPGAAYTEKETHYTNLEGRLQKTYKASFPPGDALEDWEIVNKLSELIKRKKLFKDKNELVDSMVNYLKLKSEKTSDPLAKAQGEFTNEKIHVSEIDYYYSNVIARASKTMSECRNSLLKLKRTGTDG